MFLGMSQTLMFLITRNDFLNISEMGAVLNVRVMGVVLSIFLSPLQYPELYQWCEKYWNRLAVFYGLWYGIHWVFTNNLWNARWDDV